MVTYNTSEGELVESLNQSADEFELYEYDDRYSSEDGEIEKSSDGGRTTDVGGCISDRE